MTDELIKPADSFQAIIVDSLGFVWVINQDDTYQRTSTHAPVNPLPPVELYMPVEGESNPILKQLVSDYFGA